MCGIIGIRGLPDAPGKARDALERLEYRGYDSAGIAWPEGAGIEVAKSVGRVRDIPEMHAATVTTTIGHTRWATHGGVTHENAHPHLDGTGRFALVHNGTIEGHRQIRRELEQEGHRFLGDTDSEVLVHLYERERRAGKDPLPALQATIAGREGSWAIVLYDHDADALVFARHRTPLLIGLAKEAHLLASDASAIREYTDQVVYLDDGDMGLIDEAGLQLVDVKGNDKQFVAHTIDWSLAHAELGGFAHFMQKEIQEAPVAVNHCLAGRIVGDPPRVRTGIDPSILSGARRIRILACGTSYHAGLMAQHFFETWAQIPTDVQVASEFRTRPMLDDESTLTIGISQSGETLDTLEALRAVDAVGGSILAICNVPGSSLHRMADDTLFCQVGPEIGVAATKSFLGQVVGLALLAIEAAQERGTLSETRRQAIIGSLQRLPRVLDGILDENEAYQEIGIALSKAKGVFSLGRGIHAATAAESALKFKEITYLFAEGFGAAELKHGPFALLDQETPCVFFLPDDAWYQKTIGNVIEVHARGAPVTVITQGDPADVDGIAERVNHVPKTDSLLATIPFSLIGQMLSYHAAVSLGRSVDRPRNLAKSVTVE